MVLAALRLGLKTYWGRLLWLDVVSCQDISVKQHYKSEHWAPCRNQTRSWYDWKIVESDVKLEQTNFYFSSETDKEGFGDN